MSLEGRDISMLDYFNVLQVEYLLYELRTKIYPSKSDKERYKEVLEFKKEKIEDISGKNELRTIFNSVGKLDEINAMFYNDFGIPKGMSNRDRYFYYFVGADFSYKGEGVKLLSYNFREGTAVVKRGDDEISVDITQIKRIL